MHKVLAFDLDASQFSAYDCTGATYEGSIQILIHGRHGGVLADRNDFGTRASIGLIRVSKMVKVCKLGTHQQGKLFS